MKFSPNTRNKTLFTTAGLWIVSSLWISTDSKLVVGSQDSENNPLFDNAQTSIQEYDQLKNFQRLTLDLQMLELVIKNRKDEQLEKKISTAIAQIDSKSSALSTQFSAYHMYQIEKLKQILDQAKTFNVKMQIQDSAWVEVYRQISEGTLNSGIIEIPAKIYSATDNTWINFQYPLFAVSTLQLGNQTIFNLNLPETIKKTFWEKAARVSWIKQEISSINLVFDQGKTLGTNLFYYAHSELYNALEDYRYSILTRMQNARKTLVQLSKSQQAMTIPMQYAELYNELLDQLYAYGINISVNGTQRDFKVQGFLFGENPENAKRLLDKLKFTAPHETYNSPSS